MNKVFGVVDANSAYWTPEGESDYDRAIFVVAGSPAEACAFARESGFDGLLVASEQPAGTALASGPDIRRRGNASKLKAGQTN